MSKPILAITVLTILFSASIFSKDKADEIQSEIHKAISEKENAEKNKETKRTEPTEVKNIWKNMPSYDRYGNEITARARENMLQNSLSLKSKETDNKNFTESRRVK